MPSTDGATRTEEQQNAIAIEISGIAWRNAEFIVHDEQYADVAQTVVLDCLILLREGSWNVPAEWLRGHIRQRVIKTWANLRRGNMHLAERQYVFAAELTDSTFEGMLHVLQFDAGDLRYALVKHLGTLPDLPVHIWVRIREDNLTYKAAAAEFGISVGLVHKHLSLVNRKIRQLFPILGIMRPHTGFGGRPLARVTAKSRRSPKKRLEAT